jgi:GAF domain-containing protein
VSSESRRRIAAALSAVAEDEVAPTLCSTCASLVGLRGAAIVVVTDGAHRVVLCSSNATASVLEDLQTTLGEGPGIDAYRRGVPVVEDDLAHSGRSQWLAFAEPALEAGAAAVFAFPLRVGAVPLGALTFSHDRPGRLSDDQYADARTVADVVTQVVLALQAKAPPGMVAQALAAAADDAVEIHQATGMLSVRLGVTLGEAMVRLRAIAYSEGLSLAEVARDVIARRSGRP